MGKSSGAAIVLIIALFGSITGIVPINFSLSSEGKPTIEIGSFELYPTSDVNVYERHIEFQLFTYAFNLAGIDVNASSWFSLDKLAWLKLMWQKDGSENAIALNSLPPALSYEYKKDNIVLFLALSLTGLTARVQINEPHTNLPIVALACFSPY